MDFVTVGELGSKSVQVWGKFEAGEEMVVTRNGKPFAILVHTDPSELEETLRAFAGRASTACWHSNTEGPLSED